jgi:hypothetical protein
MKFSQHYLGYTEKTLIVVTNNEVAKLYGAFDRDVEEVKTLEFEFEAPEARASGTPNSAPPDLDELKKHNRHELYASLSRALKSQIKKGYKDILLCVPEAYKNEIVDAMHTDVMKAVIEVVPKNLASLQLDQIIRILQEKKPTTQTS